MKMQLKHLSMCAPIVVIAVIAVVAGASMGFLPAAVMCMLMMAAMMGGMSGGGDQAAPLIALGISAAWLYSTVAVIAPSIFPEDRFAEVYYDISAVVVALVTLGLALETRAKGRSSEAIRKLVGLQARTARVLRDGVERDTSRPPM